MSLAEYLDTRGAGPVIRAALEASYVAEYGLELEQQSALNFLLFIHADRRSRFMPFGVFSDERYHVVEGNDRIARASRRISRGRSAMAHRLARVGTAQRRPVELTFDHGGGPTVAAFDHACAHASVHDAPRRGPGRQPGAAGMEADAIDQLGYGTNAKMMVGFNGTYWRGARMSGASYSDLANLQTTWETNPTTRGRRARVHGLLERRPGLQHEPAERCRRSYAVPRGPGASAAGSVTHVARDGGVVARPPGTLAVEPADPGSYTCYKPGQFTSIAGHEGTRVANLHFAGEHTNSFYD